MKQYQEYFKQAEMNAYRGDKITLDKPKHFDRICQDLGLNPNEDYDMYVGSMLFKYDFSVSGVLSIYEMIEHFEEFISNDDTKYRPHMLFFRQAHAIFNINTRDVGSEEVLELSKKALSCLKYMKDLYNRRDIDEFLDQKFQEKTQETVVTPVQKPKVCKSNAWFVSKINPINGELVNAPVEALDEVSEPVKVKHSFTPESPTRLNFEAPRCFYGVLDGDSYTTSSHQPMTRGSPQYHHP
jgi:hypothetical protein